MTVEPDVSALPSGRTLFRDLRFAIPIWIALAGVVAGASWKGHFFPVLLVGFVAALYGIPTLALIWAATLVFSRPWARVVRRVANQAVVLVVLAAPLPFLGAWMERASIRHTQRRGDELVQRLETHRSRHGAYPASLDALEGHQPLARPTLRGEFHYSASSDGKEFEISFSGGGIVTVWFWSSRSGRWIED